LPRPGTRWPPPQVSASPGSIRAFEAPHTGTNYLLREMVHVIGRKHALKLRAYRPDAGLSRAALPCADPGRGPPVLGGLAVLSHAAGMAASRWLFFAEAEHVVGLYYGKRG
jgi:sulfite dehydrogenase (quinone) subunit SoeC